MVVARIDVQLEINEKLLLYANDYTAIAYKTWPWSYLPCEWGTKVSISVICRKIELIALVLKSGVSLDNFYHMPAINGTI